MIKKLSLLMLLMALFAPWAADAQETLTVYENETSTNSYVPLYGLDGDYYQKCEFVIPSNELQNMTGGTISQMAFYTGSTTPANPWSGPFQVFLKEVQSTSISAFSGTTGATTVYNGTLDATSGTMNVVFNGSTPTYTYGGGNLLVGVYLTSTTGNWKSANFYGKTVSDACVSGYDNDALESCTATQRNFIPRITFTYIPSGNYCLKPTLNPAEYIEEEQASMSWTENGTATSWVLQYSTSNDFSNAISVNRNGIPAIVIHDLSPSTLYYARVKALCGDENENNWSNVISFHTACGAITTLPWSEDFNSYSGSSTGISAPTGYPDITLPNCWQFLNRSESSSTYPQAFLTSYSEYAVSGNCLFFKSSSSTPLYAVLPEFSSNISGLQLTFTYRNEGATTSNGTLYVSYMTDPNDASTFNDTNAVACSQTTTKTTKKVTFTNAPIGSYIAFRYTGGSSNNYYLSIDDVSVKTAPSSPLKIVAENPADDEMTWDQFAGYVAAGDDYQDKTVTLMEDITITSQAHQAGADGKYFSGTFEGNGKTITVNMTGTGNHCAPFYGVNNAAINNLVVTGSITSAYQGVGGICGVASGNSTFTNCVSNVDIVSTCSDTPGDNTGWSTCGGFVGSSGGLDNPTFIGCAFTGSLTATRNNCGGFVGFHASHSNWSSTNYGGQSTYTNCVFAPSSINISNNQTAVFTCGYNAGQYVRISVTNCYYNEEGTEMNFKQNGKQAYTITAESPVTVAMNGEHTYYNVSGIDAYGTGLVYGDNIYAGNGDNVSLALSGSSSDVYEANHGTLTADGENFTLAMEAYNTVISALTCPAPTDVTVNDITAHEATVTWAGTSDSYNVMYRTAAYLDGNEEGFDLGNLPSGWENKTGLLSNVMNGTALSSSTQWYFGNQNGVFDYHARIEIYGSSRYGWLITPEIRVLDDFNLSFDLALTYYSGTASAASGTRDDDRFVVLVYADDAWHILREWNNSGSSYVFNNIPTMGQNVRIDLSSYAGKTVKVAFYGESTVSGNGDNNIHIDNVAIGLPIAAGEWQTITAEETTATLTGLIPETFYEVVVQGDCGENGLSNLSSPAFFTTEISCPAPTDVTVSDITSHEATVTWNGSNENYVVEVGSYDYTATPTNDIIQKEGFESGSMPTGWTHIGNGSVNMYSYSSHVHGGTYSLQFSGATADNVLVFPQFAARPNSLQISFWSQAEGSSSGNFDIGYVTDASDASSFVAIQSYSYSLHSTYQFIEDISMSTAPANARIAFRHRSEATNWYWFIDDITIKGPVYPLVWTEYTTDNPTYSLEDLTSETPYFVSVQSDCGEEGMSAMSNTITFITDISCPAPTELEATDITSNSAVLNWTGDAESYNVNYYKAFYFYGFEEGDDSGLDGWTIIKNGDESSYEWHVENPNNSSSDLYAHSGDYVVSSEGFENTLIDNWLISPQITIPDHATLKFWVRRVAYDDYQDEYEVLLSNSDNDTLNFNFVLKDMTAANSEWTEEVIDLSAYSGQQCYIAFHHKFFDGFFIKIDDIGIYGWSEPIATTDSSLLIEDLLPETEYLWQVQANCGDEDGLSQWSSINSFTTLKACPVPFDLTATETTAYGATIAWTGYNDSYEVMVSEGTYMSYDFEDNTISTDFTTTTVYPWTVVENNHSGAYCAKSGNGGYAGTTSDLVLEVNLTEECTLSFSAKISSESYDKAFFSIDGTDEINGIYGAGSWIEYSYPLTAGPHTLRWYYTKDGSINTHDDCFYVDDITIISSNVSSWITYNATESPLLLNDATNILPETTYLVKVIGFCDDVATEDSEIIAFTTLDESTKIFVIEGDWSDGGNWVPVGVPTIGEDVILRAEATVFDVAEANIITIDDAGALIIEDGGQLKTNADVTATMKKYIIGYGTDYVETNYGYYLMALPTAAPISATDAGLITEESDYDLYSWDRTATDEEWQNNHDGIDLQNGVGYLYSNRDDMEMSFTATLRNSSEPITLTAEYDDVEHGGWSLFGNPFPCEAYITTDAEGMTFYRLVDNELVPVEGAIAPMEAFFVKATAAGQSFTISREAPDESK